MFRFNGKAVYWPNIGLFGEIMEIYGDSISGNCLKVKWTADLIGIGYRWIETGVLDGETRTPAYLAMNPAGQVPLLRFDARWLSRTRSSSTSRKGRR